MFSNLQPEVSKNRHLTTTNVVEKKIKNVQKHDQNVQQIASIERVCNIILRILRLAKIRE